MYETLIIGAFAAVLLAPCFLATYLSEAVTADDEPVATPNTR